MTIFPSERTFQMTTQNFNPVSQPVSVSARKSTRLMNQSDSSSGFEITNSKFSLAFNGGMVFFKEYPTIDHIQNLRWMLDILTDSLIEEQLP
jgi:hypothetical protein